LWYGARNISGGKVITLVCGKNLTGLGILMSEGLNITAFLDHLEACLHCSQEKGRLIEELNKVIGGERND
jgi:hypothetical protein